MLYDTWYDRDRMKQLEDENRQMHLKNTYSKQE